jgi:hypothetical protein
MRARAWPDAGLSKCMEVMMKSNRLLVLACVTLISGCAAGVSGPDTPGGSDGTGATAGTTSSTTGSPGSGAGGSESTSSSSAGTGAGSPAAGLPLTVSTTFVPSGYMGDGATANSVVMLPLAPTDPQDCGGDRSPPALGVCYTVTYVPVPSGDGWAGIYWQYPANNWGAMSGLAIPSGATQVTVWAKGAAGGEILTLVAGGIQTSTMAHEDTFKADTVATLTTSWAEYTIMLPSTYGPVLGGFAWSMTAPMGGASAGFSIDSIEWQ